MCTFFLNFAAMALSCRAPRGVAGISGLFIMKRSESFCSFSCSGAGSKAILGGEDSSSGEETGHTGGASVPPKTLPSSSSSPSSPPSEVWSERVGVMPTVLLLESGSRLESGFSPTALLLSSRLLRRSPFCASLAATSHALDAAPTVPALFKLGLPPATDCLLLTASLCFGGIDTGDHRGLCGTQAARAARWAAGGRLARAARPRPAEAA
mmetsp:Transcript_134793/g.349291  ORF Transcript_134793/g.349291 Transcript_134793/m.349291 type:complete len:210 (-) Transcript_134793:4-633(-)